MAKRRKVGNLLALAVLSYLTQQPMHPYQLGRALRDHGDARSIKFNHGSLYMVVRQLAKAGFIVEQETTRDGGRPETRGLVASTLATGVHPLFLVEEDYRLALLDADSAFVERFIEQITHPETGWGRLWAEFHGEPATNNERQES